MRSSRPSSSGLLSVIILLQIFLYSPFAKGFGDGSYLLDDTDRLQIPAHMASYWIAEEALTVEQVMDDTFQQWTPIDKASINVGPQTNPVWHRIPLKNITNETIERVVEIRWINIKHVQFFLKRQDTVEHQEFGITPQGNFYESGNSSFLFPFTLQANESAVLYIYAHTQYFSFLPTYVWKADSLSKNQSLRLAWYCLGFGGLLALLLYNISLSILTRERVYYIYCAYVVSIIFYELSYNGLGNQFLWGQNPWIYKHALALGIYLSFFWGSLFLREFVFLQKESPWLQWIVNLSAIYWLIMLATLFILDRFFHSAIYVCLICCIAALIIPLYLWYKGNQAAKIYCLAWSVLLFFTTGILLVVSGYMPFNIFTENGQLVGFLIEMLMFSIALAGRINVERAQREQAQAEALSLQRHITQERETTIRLQQQLLDVEKQNKLELAGMVEERTRELAKTMNDLQEANQQLAKQSVTDSLTGIKNRRYFDETLERELRRAEREHKPLSLILLDIDHFKRLNDNYGHQAGDQCLKLFANQLKRLLPRASDLVARYGGEEFAVILPDTDAESAALLAEKLRQAVEAENIRYNNQTISLTTSLGVTTYETGTNPTATRLLSAADHALYQAKEKGRNRWVAANATQFLNNSNIA